mmetsp:Transcript_47021/g.135478  ORF Transcript_47021/g.135478 Transcript_47021/m.135478 type:complete len:212 (-) Transcript_47021:275-910(-)
MGDRVPEAAGHVEGHVAAGPRHAMAATVVDDGAAHSRDALALQCRVKVVALLPGLATHVLVELRPMVAGQRLGDELLPALLQEHRLAVPDVGDDKPPALHVMHHNRGRGPRVHGPELRVRAHGAVHLPVPLLYGGRRIHGRHGMLCNALEQRALYKLRDPMPLLPVAIEHTEGGEILRHQVHTPCILVRQGVPALHTTPAREAHARRGASR